MSVLAFTGSRLWVRLEPDGRARPAEPATAGADWLCETFEAPDGGVVRALDVPLPPAEGEGAALVGLRELYDQVDPGLYARAQQAFQLLHWRRTHRFCGACGALMRRHATERAMHCDACVADVYPRINPVAITRITRDGRILLARRATGLTTFFSVIAGFVEAGESLEQTVAREVREEVGLDVRNIRYFASQTWPFPNNLMIAFTAEHAGGEIRPDGVEIAEADWFAPDALPPIPHPISISRRLIDDFVAAAR